MPYGINCRFECSGEDRSRRITATSTIDFDSCLISHSRFLESSRVLPSVAASTKVSRVFSSSPGFCSFDEGFSCLLELSRFLQLRQRFLESSRVLPVFAASTKVSRVLSSSPGPYIHHHHSIHCANLPQLHHPHPDHHDFSRHHQSLHICHR